MSSPPPDEELLPQPRAGSPARRALAGGAAVLVLGALVARAVDKGHGPGPSSPSPTASSTASLTASTPPPHALRSTVGPPVADCPAQAVCSRTTGLPDPTLEALRAAFPSVVLLRGRSVLAQRQGRFDPDLLSRYVLARAGDVTVTVQLSKPPANGRPDGGTHRVGRDVVTFVDDFVPGFAVSIAARRPAGRPAVALPALEKLAADRGLVAPE